jgi:SAM-dependent methyltransferase
VTGEQVLAEQRRYYAERAPEYDDWWYKRGPYALDAATEVEWWAGVREVESALAACGPLGDVVELAAGTGIWTRRLVGAADRVIAVDVNPETLALNTCAAEHVLVDLFEWQPVETYDFCFFSYWLSHVPERHVGAFWQLVRSLLRRDGRFFLVDTPPGPYEHHGEIELRQLADGRRFEIVKICRSPGELVAQAAEHGFALDVSIATSGHILFGSGV